MGLHPALLARTYPIVSVTDTHVKISRRVGTRGSHALANLVFEKVKPERPMCVLGHDVTIDMVSALSPCALVGRFEYFKLSRSVILAWVREVWKPILKTIPKVVMLINGWVPFQFLTIDDKTTIESQYQILGLGYLVLN